MKLKVQLLSQDAKLPTYATDGSACFDLYATSDDIMPVGTSTRVFTRIAVEVPEGYAMMIYSRSGHAFAKSVRLSNCVGVIDSDFRGQIIVKLSNDGHEAFEIHKGDRIAQAMLIPVPRCAIERVESLNETARGAGGFGSTGA
jgi:dUTP pyrophosphatase